MVVQFIYLFLFYTGDTITIMISSINLFSSICLRIFYNRLPLYCCYRYAAQILTRDSMYYSALLGLCYRPSVCLCPSHGWISRSWS